ncbi:G2/M phase-specific E3 ubiquitin-protein ligase-like isoform X3 [Epinephelus fuscoguttatus]|nr:G2/M phase-specific E3 ubiquitin-protein ligase-like isoform X3 [Epinephelus fuscoguttatus]
MPCGNKLVPPRLGKGQLLDASMVHKIFIRSPVYVRPSVALEPVIQEDTDTSTEEDEWVKEEDVFVPATANSPVSDRNPHGVQTRSSQPSTSGQTLHHWPDPRVQVDVSATANSQVSGSNPEDVQTPSSQPPTSDQTLIQWQNDYGTYVNLINETTDDEDDDDLYAIIASVEEKTQPKERVPISEILGELGDQIDNTQVCKFNINLSAVLDGALRGFRRLSYDPKKKTFIKFSDDRGTTEEAVDLGGPRREFLRLLIKALADSDMFSGPEGNLNLALSASAVRDDRYFIAGRAIAVSLVHGGPPPCFLSRTLFTCLTEGPDACCPVLEDITDIDLYSKLKKISEAKTLKELQQFAEPLTDYLANAGCLRPLTSLADKDKLVEDVLMFQVVQRVRGPLERFSDGLKTLGVLKKIKLHPEAFRPVMCYSPGTLTAEIMEELFDIRWSEVGSNNRADENRVVAYWRDYLQDAEEEEGPAKLGDILAFAAGCHVAPPIGFCPEPSLECQRGRYPIANTCINCLKIPLPKSYDDFKRNMDFAIQNTQGFGME